MISSRNPVLRLPIDLLIAVLTSWLQAWEVARLDCACFSRLALLNSVLSSSHCVLSYVPRKGTVRAFLKWICERNIRVNEICIIGGCDLDLLREYCSHFGFLLKMIWLVALRFADAEGMEQIIRSCPNITFLSMNGFILTDSLAQSLLGCEELQELHALQLYCRYNAAQPVLHRCLKLKVLIIECDIEACRQSLINLCSSCPLEYLSVNIYRPDDCREFLLKFTHLRAASLFNLASLSNSAVLRLLQCFSRVTHLDLGRTYSTNSDLALAIANAMPNLKVLYLVNCRFPNLFLTTLTSNCAQSLHVLCAYNSMATNRALGNALQLCSRMHTLYFTLSPFGQNPRFSCMCNLTTLVIDSYPPVGHDALQSTISDITQCCRQLQHLGLKLPSSSFESVDFTIFSVEVLPFLSKLDLHNGQFKSTMTLYPSLLALKQLRPLLHVKWNACAFVVDFRHFVDTIV